ncbi:MAG: hypothetical protein MJ198_04595 [Bacteroidales bacterium]|nr:hypothetical protein [Bacteroidales bacterium]
MAFLRKGVKYFPNKSLILFVLIFCASCQKKDDVQRKKDCKESVEIKLGKQINDPYRLENMQQAYDNLYGDLLKTQLQPTHKYVRFLPSNETEWGILKSDTTLILYDFPLDFEVIEGSGTFHDKEILDSCITWQYTVVPYDYVFPNVYHELMYEVFIPEQIEEDLKCIDFSSYKIEEEAYRLTGNAEENSLQLKSSRWNPSGRITVEDNIKGIIGVPGASVHTRWCTNIKTCLTDENGYFSQPYAFLYCVNYSIKWERNDFDIRSGDYGQAWYNGPKMKSSWELHIKKDCLSWMYAHIHRAAVTYYYNNTRYGLSAPPRCGGILSQQKLHIGAKSKIGRSKYLDFKKIIQSSQIAIYGYKKKNAKQEYEWYASNEIFSTTIHELAHASHWYMGYSTLQYCIDYITSSSLIAESWASCVEWYVSKDVYGYQEDIRLNMQREKVEDMFDGYTSLFIDIIDDYNQNENLGEGYPMDRVKDYSMKQIETALDKTYLELKVSSVNPEILQTPYETFGLKIFKKKLKSLYDNSTESYIDELFENFQK